MQLSTVVFHILLMRLPLETSDTLRKIGGHVVFAESQSGAFRTVIPQSILRITHYAIPQIINIRAQPVSVANHVKACQSMIERAVMWLATKSGWARSKRSAIYSGKLCGGFIIFEQCCLCVWLSSSSSYLRLSSKLSYATFTYTLLWWYLGKYRYAA